MNCKYEPRPRKIEPLFGKIQPDFGFCRAIVTARGQGRFGSLAKRMVEAKDLAEASQLHEEIVHGFYGDEPHS